MNEISLNRRLRLWRYEPSHSQLVFVSKKDKESRTRKIVIFKGVTKISSSTWFFCTSIKTVDQPDGRIFELGSDAGCHEIVAAEVIIDDDDREYDAPIEQLEWLTIAPESSN